MTIYIYFDKIFDINYLSALRRRLLNNRQKIQDFDFILIVMR